jgi:hypothetical protein
MKEEGEEGGRTIGKNWKGKWEKWHFLIEGEINIRKNRAHFSRGIGREVNGVEGNSDYSSVFGL